MGFQQTELYMPHQIAQVIDDGEEQILIFPESFRIDAEEVTIHRIEGGGLVLSPHYVKGLQTTDWTKP